MIKITSSISKIYAKALFELDNSSTILSQLDEVWSTIESSSALMIVMKNSSISTAIKIEIIDEIFNNKIDYKVLNLLKLLVQKNRFEEFEAVKIEYENMLNSKKHKKTVEITSPIELNFENRTNILFKLEKKLNCEIKPIWTIDKTLIAGLTFKFDDYVIDTSVKTKLNNLSKNIKI